MADPGARWSTGAGRLQESKKAKVAFRLASGPHRLSRSGAPPDPAARLRSSV